MQNVAIGYGRISTFGGPKDFGVTPAEDLALIGPKEWKNPQYAGLFLAEQPAGTSGLARRLNPDSFYVACRWDYGKTPLTRLKYAVVVLRTIHLAIFARPVDWGPNIRTNRIADLSPAAASALGIGTDDYCQVDLILP